MTAIMHTLAIFVICHALGTYGLPSTRIVGGRDAPVGKYPYQVSLRVYGRHIWGGSIIDKRHILTAAQCGGNESIMKYTTVHVGTNRLNESGVVYKVSKAIAHEDFDVYRRVHDVAVIRVDKDIIFNEKVKPIALANGNERFEGKPCVLTGWGELSAPGSVPNNLQEIDLRVHPLQDCKKWHTGIQATHICSYTKYGEGVCYGDTGGPLVANNTQIGIVSFGEPCAVGVPDVYTRVSAYVPWIEGAKKILAQNAN